MTSRADVDEIVDRFVRRMNQARRQPGFYDEVPEAFRIGAAGPLFFRWRIIERPDPARLARYEARLPAPLPPSLHSLAARYAYPAFEIGPILLFANTGDESVWYEMSVATFEDEGLSTVLQRNGYLQFARPATGSYDPVCFDSKRRDRSGEYPIVQLDHEAILQAETIEIVSEIAPSFLSLIDDRS